MYKDKSVRVARREGDVSGRRRECLNDERRTCRGASEDLGLAIRVSESGASYLSRKNLSSSSVTV